MSKFITFEGGEGAGKSTLMQKVEKTLSERGVRLFKTRAPGGTEVGEKIRELLLLKQDIKLGKRCELLLFLADRAQHVEEVIVPALKDYDLVLCDRFNDSTIAYQGEARGLGHNTVRGLCAFAAGDVLPDLTLCLDIDPLIGLKRVQATGASKDRIESEVLLFHQNIRRAYHEIAKKEPKRFHLLDASLSPEEVYKQAMVLINALLDS